MAPEIDVGEDRRSVTKTDVELLIRDAFEKYIPRIAEECQRKDELLKAQCQAHQVFGGGDNVKDFFAIVNTVNNHLEIHKRRDVLTRWILGFLFSGLTYQVLKDLFFK